MLKAPFNGAEVVENPQLLHHPTDGLVLTGLAAVGRRPHRVDTKAYTRSCSRNES